MSRKPESIQIRYALKELGLCAGISGVRYTTTTEVYPDSPSASSA